MKITQVTYTKEYKKGLPNFSNITVGMSVTVDYSGTTIVDHIKVWEDINQQLQIQANSTDPSWIETTETKESYKTVIKTPKGGQHVK